MHHHINVFAWDADDNLWVNETGFPGAEKQFTTMPENFRPAYLSAKELFKTEIAHMLRYGHGVKALTLPMPETALRITANTVPTAYPGKSRDVLNKPVIIQGGVETFISQITSDTICDH
ncbi:hypothetical protein [Chitinophaga sancti]|uniref:Putative hydrolase of the HAD superfamily n=1 Tax=Chitinophaga sancti TaxID=1004 RepID=A0A1K1MYN4_9BACT|nr:hypothetical protein [Chitinophaga sancti]WQD63088.1 hypothetical protein U0033_01680 [Chitinophaga sancti]WQG91287.1 hypothetical protein SR876_07235 [Chitinophaga sancti]SFW28153.1 putative hydrolase of the HAD superfamily [Chitinophaga sancti]